GDVYKDRTHKKNRINKDFLSKPGSVAKFNKNLGLEEYYYEYSLDDGRKGTIAERAFTIDDNKYPPNGFASWPLIFCNFHNNPETQCTAGFSISRDLQGFYRFEFRHLKDFRSLHLYIIETIGNLQEK
ncbi:hypothetical protein, partial [Chitinibacter sp. ZOR0017]|uniref:hypothetical protein n=1 Tax=Chitinibacter sp. ZOR0017 TaxID=1339254 RepID=UPI0018CD0736